MNPSNTSSLLARDVEGVTAATLMSQPVATIEHTASVRQVVEQLAANGIGAVVVLRDTSLVGVVSERDVVMHLALGADPDHLEAGEIMQDEVVTISGGATVAEAARTMVVADVRHLPVMVEGEVRGMLSSRDVLRSLHGPAAAGG